MKLILDFSLLADRTMKCIWINRRQVSIEEYIAAVRVLFLRPLIVILPMSDSAAFAGIVILRVRGDQRVRKPTDLLGGRLLPGAPLAWNALGRHNAPLHRLLLEHTVNSGGIVLHLFASLRRFERFELTWLPRIHVVRFLGDKFNCEKQIQIC